MRIKKEVPTESGMYLFKSTKVDGSFIPCVVIIDHKGNAGKKGQEYALLPGQEGMVPITNDQGADHVEWIGPFTFEDILWLPDHGEHA